MIYPKRSAKIVHINFKYTDLTDTAKEVYHNNNANYQCKSVLKTVGPAKTFLTCFIDL